MKASGGCLCGEVRYELEGEPIFQGHCHCVDCQKATGTGHVSVLALPADCVRVTGKTSSYAVVADSGQPYTRYRCAKCGSLVYGEPAAMPGVRTVTAGTLDDVSLFRPEVVVYVKDRPAWDRIDSGLPEFDGMPTPAEAQA